MRSGVLRVTVICVPRRFALPERGLDAAIAVGVGIFLQLEVWLENLHPRAVSSPAGVLLAATLLWRRRFPLAALLVAAPIATAISAAGVPQQTSVGPIVALAFLFYSVAAYEPLRRALLGLAVSLASIWAARGLASLHGQPWDWTDVPWIGLLVTAPWLVGRAMRGRVDQAEQLTRRAERLERERLAAVNEERGRIARELHDVIAHSVSVMVVQAGGAEELFRSEPERALASVRAVQETGRAALVELARLLGMLRRDGEEIGLAPQPGLADLSTLVAQVSAAGLPVELRMEGKPRPLQLGVDLSGYRIVQEALTNVRKHAGEGARASVLVRYDQDALTVEVTDDGTGSRNGVGGGHGLVGMRERVALFGGQLESGPQADGGFRVRARLPLREST